MSSPTYFPYLNAQGILTQLPYTSGRSFRTTFQEQEFSRPYSYALFGGGLTNFPTNPLSAFLVNYPAITDAEMIVLKTFFQTTAEGKLNPFAFIDPGGNLVPNSEDFTQSNWTLSGGSISGTGVSDPFGGTRATSFTASALTVKTQVIPLGGVTSYVFCASVYSKVSASGVNLVINFYDVTSGLNLGTLAQNNFALPTNTWVRRSAAVQCGVADPIGVSFSFSSGNPVIFGPSCTATMGPGAYRKTPGADALHLNCRFDTDEFSYLVVGPNQNSVSLPVQEFWP